MSHETQCVDQRIEFPKKVGSRIIKGNEGLVDQGESGTRVSGLRVSASYGKWIIRTVDKGEFEQWVVDQPRAVDEGSNE